MMVTAQCPAIILTTLLLLLSSFLFVTGQNTSRSDIRLVDRDGTTGGNKGRVEVLHNGRWGTICDDGWGYNEARVACRMLGFENAICAADYAHFGQGYYSSPIWMDDLMCYGEESELSQCYFRGWGNHDCSHYEDAGVVCSNDEDSQQEQAGVPEDIYLIESSTSSLTLGWTAPTIPGGSFTRYRIRYRLVPTEGSYYYTYPSSTYCESDSVEGEEVACSLNFLRRDANYSIYVRMEYRNPDCSPYSYTYGNYSATFYFQTNATRKQSNIQLRLVQPSDATNMDFLGRLEVFHDNEWGTVCDDRFGNLEADIACHMLNFTGGAICRAYNGGLGQGRGRIWMDDVDCSYGDEVFEDCEFNDWGTNDCTHFDDVGVICQPNGPMSALPPVQNFTVLNASARSITVGWNPYQFPSASIVRSRGFQVYFNRSGYYYTSSYTYASSSLTGYNIYTKNYLTFGIEYNISVRPFIIFSLSGCYNRVYGEFSDVVAAETVETAPLAPPEDFHLVAINTTSIEVQWDLPPYNYRGGVIRGYKIFVRPATGGQERTIIVPDNVTDEYIVTGLQRDTLYRFSVLAFTSAGDGPRTLILTLDTLDYDPLITKFGYYGNNLDRYTCSSWISSDVHILCGSNNITHAVADWFFSNGTRVGVRDRNFRVGHYQNGTAVLQIQGPVRTSLCWGGNYSCVVNADDYTERRNFTLLINYSPPRPQRLRAINVQSNRITIGWEYPVCDGGHGLSGFQIQYRYSSSYYYYYNYDYIYGISSDVRNYTISNLLPQTEYLFNVKAYSSHGRQSQYSSYVRATTLPEAPSPPRNVTVRLVQPLTVEVRWRSPALSSGNISHFTVYATPILPSGNESTTQQVSRIFPSDVNAGNISLAIHSVFYHFRVGAATIFEDTYNEGELSSLTTSSRLFVPKPKPDIPATTPPVVTGRPSTSPSTSLPQSANRTGATAGEIGGITVGVLIFILLAILIVVLLIKKIRSPIAFKRMGRDRSGKEEHMCDEAPFGGTESKRSSMFDLDDSRKLNTDL